MHHIDICEKSENHVYLQHQTDQMQLELLALGFLRLCMVFLCRIFFLESITIPTGIVGPERVGDGKKEHGSDAVFIPTSAISK